MKKILLTIIILLSVLNADYINDGIVYKYDLTNFDDNFKYGFDVETQLKDKMIKAKNPAHDFSDMGGILGYIPKQTDSIVPFF